MMIFIKKILLLSFLLSCFSLSMLPQYVLAASSQKPIVSVNQEFQTGKNCFHQFVHVNGTQPPRVSCLDSKEKSKGMHLAIGTVDCSQGQVLLTSTALAESVCIAGNGFLNLSSIYMACDVFHLLSCGNPWSGQAQHYTLYGCATAVGKPGNNDYPGYFASDFNGNGTRMYFKNIPNDGNFNFPGRGIRVGPYSLLIAC